MRKAAVYIRRPIHQSVFDAAANIGERELRILVALDSFRPGSIKASNLMRMVGLDWEYREGYSHNNSMEFDHYVRFACVLARVARILRHNGWWLCRTGGTYKDRLWISEHPALAF
jgi:hypothetical protein